MTNTPHQLAEDFPEHVASMRHLRQVDGHFLRISDAYDEVNRAIHRAETGLEAADDARVTEMRKRRMLLKDEIHGMLSRPELPAEELP